VEIDQRSLATPLDPARATWNAEADQAGRSEPRHPHNPGRSLVVRALLLVAAFAVASWGIASARTGLAATGLAAAAVAVLASGVAVSAWIGRLERHAGRLGRARAESERARQRLEAENAELRRQVTGLHARHGAIVDGFDWADDHTAGQLRALLDSAGLELADLADGVLDDLEEDA
jgi:hypothetical protein